MTTKVFFAQFKQYLLVGLVSSDIHLEVEDELGAVVEHAAD